jgi:hypothetical protein
LSLSVIAFLLIAFMVTWVVYSATEPEAESETGCLVDGRFPEVVVFLIDQSDPLSRTEVDDVERYVRSNAERLEKYGLLSVWKTNPSNPRAPIEVFSRCSPGPRELQGLEQWINNSRLRTKKWQDALGEPLKQELEALLSPQTQDSSPIIESVLEISKLGYLRDNESYRKLFIVSDFIQNTPSKEGGWSVLRSKNDFISDFEESRLSRRRPRTLSDVDVVAYVVERPEFIDIQNSIDFSEFWYWYFNSISNEFEQLGYTDF